ncbi:uracil-DNA glycosylase family protein [Marinobacter sp. KMM 10035]|uniref:uracil-DNA glycosylase family protein n=1 Tax=Marinobacter sp. KMM 10035 TaxID=3134034 RepID=UPI00397A4128
MEDNGADVLLIFQAPGVEEWAEGRPVCSTHPSSAGGRLARAWQRLKRTRYDYNITNTVQCFPGKRSEAFSGRRRDKKPPNDVRKFCANWLQLDIEARPYRRIVVFGTEAGKSVRELGYSGDTRFIYAVHPAGGISKDQLETCLR